MSGRTIEQARHATSWHEAGHATAAFDFGIPIARARLIGEDGELLEDEMGGCVETTGGVADLAGAEQQIVVLLAGVACSMTALATGLVPRELYGVQEPDADLAVEMALAAPLDASPTTSAIFDGFTTRGDSPDETAARELAEAFAHSSDEAGAMLAWLRRRTAAVVEDPAFMSRAGRIAAALMEFGELSGDHVTDLLRRGADLTERETA